MAHIKLQDGLPGIVGPFAFSPETAQPMRQLAEVLLSGAEHAHFGGARDDRCPRFLSQRV